MLQALGWFGTVAIFTGFYGMGNKSRLSYYTYIAGESAWCAKGYLGSDWALTAMCVGFVLIAVRNYWTLRKELQ
jgi:hypothetical protein